MSDRFHGPDLQDRARPGRPSDASLEQASGPEAAHFEGEPLARYLARVGRLPVFQGLAFAAQLLCALDLLHRSGVVHPGILSDDLWVSRTGQLKVLGSEGPASMPPHAAPVDPRTDLLAAAVVTYELLTGAPPFENGGEGAPGDRADLPRPVQELRPDLPPQLDAVFQRALAPRPDDRYQTAAELWAALQAASPVPCWTRPLLPAVREPERSASSSGTPDAGALTPPVQAWHPARSAPIRARSFVLAIAAAGAVVAVLAASLMNDTSAPALASFDDHRATPAARNTDAAPQRIAQSMVPAASLPPALSQQASALMTPPSEAPANVAQREREAPETAQARRPDVGASQALAPIAESRRRESRPRRMRVGHAGPPTQRLATPAPPSTLATCQQNAAIAPELCTAVRCATADYRQHPVCVAMHAEGTRARVRLAESRGGP